jgi:hypothetical protein
MTNRPDIPEEAVEAAYAVHRGTAAITLSPRGVKRMLEAAAPALRKQGAEEAVEDFERLAEETSFEPGQTRSGGLPGETASPVDHVLEQFAQCGEDLRRLEAERDQALAKGAEEERARLEAEIRGNESDRWFVSVLENGEIDRNWPANCKGRETPQERLMGDGARIVAVVSEARINDWLAYVDIKGCTAAGGVERLVSSYINAEADLKVLDALTETCPDCEGEIGGGGGNSDEPEWHCSTCIGGRVVKKDTLDSARREGAEEERERLIAAALDTPAPSEEKR